MSVREDRVIRNEDRFRQTNEGIEHLTPFGAITFQVFCECANPDCLRLLEISHDAYQAVRAHPLRFIVLHRHELPEFERIVSDKGSYLIVEKHPGDASDTARDLDPRRE
jgi:hypothetical protein